MTIGSMIEINDPTDPRIGVFLNQKDAWLKAAHNPQGEAGQPDVPGGGAEHGRFIAEGLLVVEHLLDSRYPVESVFVSHSRVPGVRPLLDRVPAGVPVYVAEQSLMDQIVGFPIHRGLLACGRRLPNPDPLRLARESRALVVLEDLSNHDNIGSIFRSVAALGGAGVGVLLSDRCCDPLYRKALRVSMGHVLRVPFALSDNLTALIPRLHDLGFTSYALSPGASSEPLPSFKFKDTDKSVFCFGAEGPGLSDELLGAVRHRVRIPMAHGVDSLNIAVSAAVTLYACIAPSREGSDRVGGQAAWSAAP